MSIYKWALSAQPSAQPSLLLSWIQMKYYMKNQRCHQLELTFLFLFSLKYQNEDVKIIQNDIWIYMFDTLMPKMWKCWGHFVNNHNPTIVTFWRNRFCISSELNSESKFQMKFLECRAHGRMVDWNCNKTIVCKQTGMKWKRNKNAKIEIKHPLLLFPYSIFQP